MILFQVVSLIQVDILDTRKKWDDMTYVAQTQVPALSSIAPW